MYTLLLSEPRREKKNVGVVLYASIKGAVDNNPLQLSAERWQDFLKSLYLCYTMVVVTAQHGRSQNAEYVHL